VTAPRPRAVSLLASATEIVAALGLEDCLVGISHECDYPPSVLDRPRASRPRFEVSGLTSAELDRAVRRAMADHGAVYEIDAARLAALRPDILFAQAVCEVCAVPTASAQAAAAELPGAPRVVSLDAHDLEGILRTILEVGAALGAEDRARALVASLRARLDAVRQRVEGRPRPGVLALEWLDPPFVPGHWVPEMIAWAGGLCLRGEPGARSRETTWEALRGADPDVLVVMPCGYGLDAARADARAAAERLRAVAPRAIARGRAFVVDGSSYFNRSGPRVVDGVEILAAILHPDAFPEVPLEGRAEPWVPAPVP
jgi:iron complex transport system substrate-binding protein